MNALNGGARPSNGGFFLLMEGGRWREIAPMHAQSLLSRFASSPLRPSSRDLVGELNDVAVLAIDGLALLEDRPFPREIALAFWGDRQDLAWRVRPEAVWSEDGSAAPAGPLGLGLPLSIVAAELAAACVGLRVFVEHHLATPAWLKPMFAAAEGVMPFPIRDLRQLVLPLSRRLPNAGLDRIARAEMETRSLFPGSWRAAREAALHLHFAKLLATP